MTRANKAEYTFIVNMTIFQATKQVVFLDEGIIRNEPQDHFPFILY